MRPGDRRTKTMDRDPNTESKAQCLAELSRLSLPGGLFKYGLRVIWTCNYRAVITLYYRVMGAPKSVTVTVTLFRIFEIAIDLYLGNP